MKNITLFLVATLIAICSSCSFFGEDFYKNYFDTLDWDSVENNVFYGVNNEAEIADGDLILHINPREMHLPGYYLTFITSSDDYYVFFRLQYDQTFPIDKKGKISYKHLVSRCAYYLVPKGTKDLTLDDPGFFWGGEFVMSGYVMVDCDVRQRGGYHELKPGTFGDKMEGNVQIRLIEEYGSSPIQYREVASFKFDGLIPYLAEYSWIQGCTGDPAPENWPK